MSKIRTNYMFTPKQHTLLREVADKMQISVSELLRRILDEWRLDIEEGTERGRPYTFGSTAAK